MRSLNSTLSKVIKARELLYEAAEEVEAKGYPKFGNAIAKQTEELKWIATMLQELVIEQLKR